MPRRAQVKAHAGRRLEAVDEDLLGIAGAAARENRAERSERGRAEVSARLGSARRQRTATSERTERVSSRCYAMSSVGTVGDATGRDGMGRDAKGSDRVRSARRGAFHAREAERRNAKLI